ncbi:acetoacetate decarboxylase [Marmoricola endophyticus]|uniref:Acetoacetate decarboxylase n=1 Tax=Marmoricola endophyticus TaxID=2040280 RepID=A0A917BVG4_9ACTN|nr:acetoacetate decarboxylase family protein [Marmoricola endophyticus]GGF56067.1 acetoacetate decarboxylase [Marmoricola endophyticus]
MSGYPPEPWHLTGRCVVGVWLLPSGVAPVPDAPGARVVRVLGRTVVAAAFFSYAEPSPLTYEEVMATVLVRRGPRPRVSITHIWVDSPASRDGGRALWAIPKELARFETGPGSWTAPGIGAVRMRPRRLPLVVPLAFRLLQGRAGAAVETRVGGRVRPALGRARWSVDADGPLGFLAGRRPVLTFSAVPFRLVFGRRR